MNRKNSELPKIRITTELHDEIQETLKLINENNEGIEIKLPEFRRMSLIAFCKEIKQNGLSIDFVVK